MRERERGRARVWRARRGVQLIRVIMIQFVNFACEEYSKVCAARPTAASAPRPRSRRVLLPSGWVGGWGGWVGGGGGARRGGDGALDPLGVRARARRTPPRMPPRARRRTTGAAAARASFVQCPCCGRSVPDVLINAHLDAGCDGGSQAQTQTQTQTQLATQGVTPQTHRPGAGLRADAGRDSTGGDESQEAPQAASRVPPPTASPEGRKKPKGNALAALMTGARKAATRRERFHLGRDAATGRWKCSWTSGKAECEAAAASAWSATMVIKESSAGECVLTLSTDFAP